MERPVNPFLRTGVLAFGFRRGSCNVPAGAARRDTIWPERRAAVEGAPLFGAAKRTLDCEHRSGIQGIIDGRLVGFERGLDSKADDSPVASITTLSIDKLVWAGLQHSETIPGTCRCRSVRYQF
jgi:hypothetical protein